MTWVWPVRGRIKEQTVGKPLQPKVHGRTSCGLRIIERFRLSNLRVKYEHMPAQIGHSCIFLNFTSRTVSGIRAENGVVAGLGKLITAIHFVDFITFKDADAAAAP